MKPSLWLGRLPWSIPLIVACLIGLGLVALDRCEDFGDGERHYFNQQVLWGGIGLATVFLATLPGYRRLCRFSYLIFGLAVLLLVAVFFFPAINGSHRWLRVGRIGLQPSEFAKVAFVLALGRYLMYRENYRRLRGLVIPLGLAAAPILLILKEPDLGTASIFLPVLFLMLLVAGAKWSDLSCLLVAGVLFLPLFWMQMSPYQKSRVEVLLHPPVAGQKPSAEAYQMHQARRMVSLGGPWGSYFSGQPTDDMSVYHLPEDHTDFILCVVGERFGLPGLALVLFLYGALVWRMFAVAAASREPFGRLLAAGMASLLGVQAMVNAGVTVGLLPVTGLPLPLVSYGGSGVLAHCLAAGLVLNVALRPGYEVTNEPFRYRVD